MSTRHADIEMLAKIQSLIEDEADPRERTRLLILFEIARGLNDSTRAVREVTTEFREHRLEFESHVDDEQKLINQGKGMWRVVVIGVIVIQSALSYVIVDHFAEMQALRVTTEKHSKQLEVIAERHRQEERFRQAP